MGLGLGLGLGLGGRGSALHDGLHEGRRLGEGFDLVDVVLRERVEGRHLVRGRGLGLGLGLGLELG